MLGRVVDALVRKNKYHVPYYESRLTTLLQPAFGGNARTTILIAASPDDKDGDEALAALRAARADDRKLREALENAGAETALGDAAADYGEWIRGA